MLTFGGKFGFIWLFLITSGSTLTEYPSKMRFKDYDYIIVGAGSSGSVVANRLSEDNNVTVLLLEAGGPIQAINEIPIYTTYLINNKSTNWDYYSEPQKNACYNQDGQRCFYSQYKALGGCSSHNGMVYVRGSAANYDNWAKLGASGWSWDGVLPYFKKAEGFRVNKIPNNGYHGTNGPVTISGIAYKTRGYQAFEDAGKDLGYKPNPDYNGAVQIGFSGGQVNIRDGLRCGTEKAYLRPAVKRSNLDILTYAFVRKINIDKMTKTATSVDFDLANKTRTISARREIILSAGVFGSTKLLLLSGIGPKKHLMDLGIPLVANLPVGENFHDHAIAGEQVWYLNRSVLPDTYGTESATTDLLEGKGPLTSAEGYQTQIFVNTKYENSTNWPDFQCSTFASVVLPSNLGSQRSDVTKLLPFNNKPKSRGYVKLRSNNPYDKPIIDPQLLTHEEDVQRLVEGLKFLRTVMATPALQKFDPQPNVTLAGDCANLDVESDEYLTCLIRWTSRPGDHGCGTAKMGNPSDPSTVVDPKLRVKGVKRLRVADASIMPLVVNGNTNAVCIMIGEKAAAIIKGN